MSSIMFLAEGADVAQHLGSRCQLHLKNVSTSCDAKQVYVKGAVKKKGPIQRTKCQSLVKAIIEQDEVHIAVFFLGKCAEEVEQMVVGDIVWLSNVIIENNTHITDGQLPYQLLVDPSKSHPHVWILHNVKHNRIEVESTPSVPTSTASTTKINTTNSSKRSYNYKQLKDLKGGDNVNVYGVVKYFKSPSKTRGSDYSMFISIVDNSGGDKLKCLIFARDEKCLPPITRIGEVVRFHRLQIKEFNEELQGQASYGCGFSCLVYSGDIGGSLTPKSTKNTYTCTASDNDKVVELREWASDDCVLSQILDNIPDSTATNIGQKSLQCLRVGQYFDLVCQVIGKCRVNATCFLLKVWDGTSVPFPTKEETLYNSPCLDWLDVDEQLQVQAAERSVDIYVFDDHFNKASAVEPGDFIKMSNLHAAQYPDRNPTAHYTIVPVELTLHGGGASYKRDLTKLDETHHDVLVLKEQLAATGILQGDSLMDNLSPHPQNSEERLAHGEGQRSEIISNTEKVVSSSFDSENRCMLNTATVLKYNQEQRSSTMTEVLQHSVPHKFRLMCHVKDYMPKPQTPFDLVKLYCAKCNYLSAVPESDNDKNTSAHTPVYYKQEKGLNLYACPVCKGQITERVLQYIMCLQLLLHDSSGWIVAGLWREAAEMFFRDITAEDILLDAEAFQYIKTRLLHLIQPKTVLPQGLVPVQDCSQPIPLLECCIKSYITANGVGYHIFDTCLEWSDLDT